MFGKKRALEMTVVKRDKKKPLENEQTNDLSFYQKADYVLRRLEKTSTKVFVGVCGFVVLNAVCKVFVEVNKNPEPPEK